jgi:hypothetical protein
MAGTVADCSWRRSSAEEIEDDLAALWREAARDRAISRAVMSNLVVFAGRSPAIDPETECPRRNHDVEDVVRRHPARVILLHHEPHAAAPGSADPLPAVHVGVLTFGPEDARYGVEQIVVRSVCGEAALPSIVRRLIRGDVPTSVWWREDLSDVRPLRSLVTMGRQLVYDSREWTDVRGGLAALRPIVAAPGAAFQPDLADLNWRRLAPVRQALAHVFESQTGAGQSAVDAGQSAVGAVRVRCRPDEEALAWLLAGWVDVVVGRAGPTAESKGPELRAAESKGPELRAAGSKAPGLHVDLRLDVGAGELLTASFGDDLRVRVDDRRVAVDGPLAVAPFTVPMRREAEAQAVASELRVLTADTMLRDVLAALAARLIGG